MEDIVWFRANRRWRGRGGETQTDREREKARESEGEGEGGRIFLHNAYFVKDNEETS